MQVKIYSIPILGGEESTDELNQFLRSRKILRVDTRLVNHGQTAMWSFCITYLDQSAPEREKKRVDYREKLDKASFRRFSKMREIRKRIAQEEAIPAYAVFSDAEMAGLAQIEELTIASMKNVKGVGEKKIQRYGEHFITKALQNETSKSSSDTSG